MEVGIVVMAPVPASVIGPYLAGAQKDLVTTALGYARVWATVGQGIVTEVYWPSVGEPQIRDLGFIVAGDGWWYEVKAQNDYQFQLPDPAAPLGTAVHDGPPDHPYRLEVEVVPDPDRDALHVRFALSGVAASVYVFLASHLQTQHPDRDDAGGRANTAWVDPAGRLNAWGEGRYLCLAAAGGFRKTSVGSFGTSDVWHDFAQNGDMTWAFTEAGPGFVVLAGGCGQQGVLALTFADSEASAQQVAADSLDSDLDVLIRRQQDNGQWDQNFFPDGTPFWRGIQLDETALPILMAAKLAERGHNVSAAGDMIRKAVGFLVRTGPLTEQDRWEEDPGGSPFTLGCLVACLVAGADFLDGAGRDYVLSLADDWNQRIEEWCYVTDTWLDQLFNTGGHYVRVGPDPERGVARIANQADPNFVAPSSGVLGLEFMYLARLGLRDARDQRLVDSATIVDAMLGRNVGTGVGYHRYNYDGYGEQVNGANFVGVGVGRVWPLLVGERGHFAVLGGGDGQRELESMLAMRSASGLVPEQVWDQPPLQPRNGVPSRPLFTGKPTLSATPLVWGHSELIKLIAIRSTNRPIERLDVVAKRYGAAPPPPNTTYWRTQVPVADLRPDCNLVVEDLRPFMLHFGHDDWTDVTDRDSMPGPFGVHAVRLPSPNVGTWGSLQFRRRYEDGWDPIGDQNVRVTLAPPTNLRQHSAR